MENPIGINKTKITPNILGLPMIENALVEIFSAVSTQLPGIGTFARY